MSAARAFMAAFAAAAALFLLTALFGCSAPADAHQEGAAPLTVEGAPERAPAPAVQVRAVLIDEDFLARPEEVQHLRDGLAIWNEAELGIRFEAAFAPHDELFAESTRILDGRSTARVRLLFLRPRGRAECPAEMVDLSYAQTWTRMAIDSSFTCFDAAWLTEDQAPGRAPFDYWSAMVAHEVGHSLGMSHTTEVHRLMWVGHGPDENPRISCEDAAQFVAVRGGVVPAGCVPADDMNHTEFQL